jgi:hypothetical protein
MIKRLPSGITGKYRRVVEVPLSEVYIANVMAVYDGADDKARRAGMSWYTDCWAWCCSTGEVYNVDASVVAGIFCAFSPQCTVAYAMAITESMLARGGVARGHTSRQCETAHYVYHGGDASKLLGKHKTHHFYWGIVLGGSTDDYVCIDTWQVRLITGNRRANVVPRAWYPYCARACDYAMCARCVRALYGYARLRHGGR